jgi:IclR family acetate operon transcriptional repressor
LGKAWLAHLPGEVVRQLLKEQGMPRQTEHTIVTVSAMKAELERVRKQGYALDAEESMLGAFCVGVPVLDASGAPVLAISISGPTTRFHQAALPEASAALIKAAAEIRAKLGHA